MRVNYADVVINSCSPLHPAVANNKVLNHVFRLLSSTTMAHSTNTSAELLKATHLIQPPPPEALLTWRLNWPQELKIKADLQVNVDNTV